MLNIIDVLRPAADIDRLAFLEPGQHTEQALIIIERSSHSIGKLPERKMNQISEVNIIHEPEHFGVIRQRDNDLWGDENAFH